MRQSQGLGRVGTGTGQNATEIGQSRTGMKQSGTGMGLNKGTRRNRNGVQWDDGGQDETGTGSMQKVE